MKNLTIRARVGLGWVGVGEEVRGVGAHWAQCVRCGLALDGAKDERGFISCFFRRSGVFKTKKDESNLPRYSQEST